MSGAWRDIVPDPFDTCRLMDHLMLIKRDSVFLLSTILMLTLLRAEARCQSVEVVFSHDSSSQVYLARWKFHEGDSLEWSRERRDDSRWITKSILNNNPGPTGRGWLRTSVIIDGIPRDDDRLVIRVQHLHAAYEIFWDGERIGTNGLVGAERESEQRGLSFRTFMVSRNAASQGRHLLAIRYSQFHDAFMLYESQVVLGRETHLESQFLSQYRNRLFFLGGCFFGALFCFMLYIGSERNRLYLLLFFIYSFRTILLYIELLHLTTPIPLAAYDYVALGTESLVLLAILIDVVFFLHLLEFSKKQLITFLFCLLLLASEVLKYIYPEVFVLVFDFVELITLVVLSSIAVKRRKLGAKIMLSISLFGLLCSLYYALLAMSIITFYIDGAILIPVYALVLNLGLVLAVGLKLREETRKLHGYELRSKQLEIEMLKKTIQPHFIINTLTSIKSLILKKPRDAGQLIDALAGEFWLIGKYSAEKEIPLSTEVELCEHHLEVMGHRRKAEYTLVKQDLDYSLTVPPLIFHTLIENGITHAFEPKEDGTFWLSYRQEGGCQQYTLQNNGSLLKTAIASGFDAMAEGTGLKYVKTRLEERYPGKWKLEYRMKETLWTVTITITRNGT
jgi:hypothetical protein